MAGPGTSNGYDGVAPRGGLALGPSPALLIAPDEARIIAANAAGAGAIGLGPGDHAGRAMDSAMPAMARLRQCAGARRQTGAGHVEPLVFWTARGVVKLDCRVRAMPPRCGQRVLLVEPLSKGGANGSASAVSTANTNVRMCGAARADASATGAARSGQVTPLPVCHRLEAPAVRDDAETLKAIAQQIRTGRAKFAAMALATASHDAGEGGGGTGHGDDGNGNGSDDDIPTRARRKGRPSTSAQGDAAASMTPRERGAVAESELAPPENAARGGAARRTLVRRIAHELKTPLSAIVSASEIMKDERFGKIGDERYLRYARDIHESARHALEVVERMLSPQIAAVTPPPAEGKEPAVETGFTELAFVEIDIDAIVAATVSTVDVLAREAGIGVALSLAGGLPRVVADATSLRQIILNLMTNALKFTPRGGEVVIATRHVPDGPLVLEVTDNGPGISARDFETARGTGHGGEGLPRKGGGLGIGLPLVRQLAIANGAEMTIGRSDAGGARVSVLFPTSRQIPR